MCMVNMLFKKNVSKEVLVEIFNKNKVHSMSNYLYVERVNKIDALYGSKRDIENEKLKQDLLVFSSKTTVDKSDIVFSNFDAYPDYNVVGIYPEILEKRGFTAIGHSDEYYRLKSAMSKDKRSLHYLYQIPIDYISRDYDLYLEDLNFWDRIFSTMLTEYEMQDIGIYYMYPERAEEPVTFKRKKLEDIIDRDLVTMEVNRVLFIEK